MLRQALFLLPVPDIRGQVAQLAFDIAEELKNAEQS